MEVSSGYKQTEMGPLPDGWEASRLGDLATFYKGKGLPKSALSLYGSEPCVHYGELFTQYGETIRQTISRTDKSPGEFRSVANDVLMPTSDVTPRGLAKASCVVSDGVVLGGDILVIRTDPAVVSGTFLSHVIRREDDQVLRLVTGTTVFHIYGADMKQFIFKHPGLAEQQAIVTALSDVDALLGGLDRLIAKKRDIKQAAMQQLLTGQTRLPGFHGEWDTVEFGDIASIRNSKVLPSSTPAGTRCVELESIDQGTGQLLMSVEAAGLSPKYSFRKGDVLFGRLRAYLRKYWLATFDGVCSTEIWPLIARDERLAGRFLHLLVQTNDFLNAAGVSYGTHMPRTDWSVLKKVPVRLPPFAEQSAIAAVLSDMDAELAALDARRDKTRDLKQAMMQELLTGKTRLVPVGAAHA